tara:strand:+ start:1752 stop:1961 length:210 start_codon:yes stop_codon:yes gene_type:complete
MITKSRAADNKALRARRKAAGLISYRVWVTQEEKLKLDLSLDELRGANKKENKSIMDDYGTELKILIND